MDPAAQHSTNIFLGNLPAYANTVFCRTPLPSSENTGTVILSFCRTSLIYIIKFNNFTLSRYLYKIYFMPFNITEENFKKKRFGSSRNEFWPGSIDREILVKWLSLSGLQLPN